MISFMEFMYSPILYRTEGFSRFLVKAEGLLPSTLLLIAKQPGNDQDSKNNFSSLKFSS